MKKINPKKVQESYLQRMENSLKSSGAVFFEPDNGTLNINEELLTLRSNITDLTSQELGEHLNAFTQQKMFMRTLVGRMEIFVEDAKRKYLEVSTPIYQQFPIKTAESAKERIVTQDPEVKPLYEDYIDMSKKLLMLELQLNNIEDAIFLLSREITRRTGDFMDENRTHNIGR